jgi:hypothetical protein
LLVAGFFECAVADIQCKASVPTILKSTLNLRLASLWATSQPAIVDGLTNFVMQKVGTMSKVETQIVETIPLDWGKLHYYRGPEPSGRWIQSRIMSCDCLKTRKAAHAAP